jgi:anhydro-N-acetylmuramic acid kinase
MRVVGLISGTSMDGIDVAVADLRFTGPAVELTPIGFECVDYPADLRADLLAALPPGQCTAARMCELDTRVGQEFARAAGRALAAHGPADLVASLGQTIYHWVVGDHCLGTLQLGQPAWIAEATGLPVVSDLRARDVAAGGHGAPLASTLDALWLADRAEPAVALNLGGIANITVVAPGQPVTAYDTGPANALLDLAAARATDGARQQDTDGRIAATGTVRADLLAALLADPYYAAEPPKSTGKEHFHADHLARATAGLPPVSGPDLLATLVELTARTVADACRRHRASLVVGSGGGMRNPVLVAALRRALAPAELVDSADFGLPGDAKEAYLAALLGYLTAHGVPGTVPGATGASGPRQLGSITPGRGPLRLPEPAVHPVTRLRVVPLPVPTSTVPTGGADAPR